MRRPEECLQRALTAYLAWTAPTLVWFAVPNGGGRSKAEAGVLKATGVKAGVADLAFVLPAGRAGFIELKAQTGRQSSSQVEWQRRVELAGGLYAVARSVDEVRAILVGWGVELREVRRG